VPVYGIDLDTLEKLEEGLALLFYVFMFMALVIGLAGETGSAFLLLILGACAHVGRAGLAEFVARGRSQRAMPAPRAQAGLGSGRPTRVRRAA
jgi:hypothetical protein